VEDFLKAIANYGFPIVITAYLLFRMEAKLERLAGAITDLARVVATLQATTRPIEQDPIKQ
jgi:hypothetical protein